MLDVLVDLLPDGRTLVQPVRRLERFREYQRIVRWLPFDQRRRANVADAKDATCVLQRLRREGVALELGDALRQAVGLPVASAQPVERARIAPASEGHVEARAAAFADCPAPPPAETARPVSSPRAPSAGNRERADGAQRPKKAPPAETEPAARDAADRAGKQAGTASTPQQQRKKKRNKHKRRWHPETKAIAAALGEDKPHARASVDNLVHARGPDAVRALAEQAHAVEQRGGMLVPDGQRRRTVGGIFFFLARERGWIRGHGAKTEFVRPDDAQQATPASDR